MSDHIIVDRERITVIPVPLGATVMSVHEYGQCYGRACVVHHPSAHGMRHLPLHWRSDRGIFERVCSHGVGHPDPDQWAYFYEIADKGRRDDEDPSDYADTMMVHGCCGEGCCRNK